MTWNLPSSQVESSALFKTILWIVQGFKPHPSAELSSRCSPLTPLLLGMTPDSNSEEAAARKRKITKVFSHRAAYKGMVLLLLTLSATLLVMVGGISIPFDYAPYNTDLIDGMKDSPELREIIKLAQERVTAIFMLPVAGGLGVTILSIIRIWAIFRRGEKFRTMVVANIATCYWTLGIAIASGMISDDLFSYPMDRYGLSDPWGDAYILMLRGYVQHGIWPRTVSSDNRTSTIHEIHKCCGLLGFDDFFTNRSPIRAESMNFTWPKKVNSSHTEVVPEICCRRSSPDCNLQPSGKPLNTTGMFMAGCMPVFRLPLITLTVFMSINAVTAFLFCVASSVLMYLEKRAMQTRKQARKARKKKIVA